MKGFTFCILLALASISPALAGPFVRRALNETDVAEAAANNVVAVLSVTSNNGKWTVGNQAASVSTSLLECSGNLIPDSSISTGNDFVAVFFEPSLNKTNSCYFYDSSVFNYEAVVNQALQNPVTRDALLADNSKVVSCTDVEESQLPVCYELTGTDFTFAKYYTNDDLVNFAAPADDSPQYSTSSDLADLINDGEPIPSGVDDYDEIPPYLQNGTSVYNVIFFNSTEPYYIGTSQEVTFSVPYGIGNSFYSLGLQLWSTIGSQTGSQSLMIQDIANVTNQDALNDTQLSWTVNVTTSVLNVTNTTDTNATQVNYFFAVFGRRSFDGPTAIPSLPWDPVYYGIFDKVYA